MQRESRRCVLPSMPPIAITRRFTATARADSQSYLKGGVRGVPCGTAEQVHIASRPFVLSPPPEFFGCRSKTEDMMLDIYARF